MSSNATKDFIDAFSFLSFSFREKVNEMLKQFYAQTAEVANLEQIGRERNVPRITGAESDAAYRTRVVNAWDENVGRGGALDIRRVIDSYGFTFKSYVSGFVAGDAYDSYNLLIPSISGALQYDGSAVYDGTEFYINLPINGLYVQIKRNIGDPVSNDIKKTMYKDLLKIVRASMTTIVFVDVEI